MSTGRECEYEVPDGESQSLGSSSETPLVSLVPSVCSEATDIMLPELSYRLFQGFSSVSYHMNLTPLQSRLLKFIDDWGLCNYGETRDQRLIAIWTQLIPRHFNQLELVKLGLLTYLGVLIVQSYDHTLLQNPEFTGDSTRAILKYDPVLVAAYQYSLHGFLVQMREISRLVDRLQSGTITTVEAVELLLGSILLLATWCCQSLSQMPLVNFDERKHDFLSARLGVRATFMLARRVLAHDPALLSVFDSLTMIEPPQTVEWGPLFYKIFCSLDCLETPPETRELLTGTLGRFNNLVADCAAMATDVPLIQAASIMDAEFVSMVYDQDIIALEIIYVFSCFSLLASSYCARDSNMFADYMHWYKDHCFATYGLWYFPWDALVYLVVIEKNYQLDWLSLPLFDPEDIDAMLI